MTGRRSFLLGAGSLACASGLPWTAAAAPDPSRIGLVVGNDRYPASPLANAVSDARAMAELLQGAGFRIDARLDAGSAALAQAGKAFAEAVARPEVKLAFFYYAGHGVQVAWRNYLLPVDANISNVDELKRQCLDLGGLLGELARAKGREFVIVLDACRDNPFGGRWQPEQKGLSQFDAPVGSLIAFSTAPGSVASDGGGKHGLYTENLLRELAVRGASVDDALKRVRLNVRLASNGAQIPWESTSLEGDVVLFPASAPTESSQHERAEQELSRWKRLQGSKRVEDWAGFVRDFPGGNFAEIAQARLNTFLAAREKARPREDKERGTIRIGEGHSVPAFLARPANPYSAGTYPLDRHFEVGDRATYVETDPATGQRRRTYTARVTRVDRDADRVEINNGATITDLLGNPIRIAGIEYDAPVQMNPAQLQVGKRWAARYRATKHGGGADVDMTFEIAARERVVVPAGEFQAFRIEGRSRVRRAAAEGRPGGLRQRRADRERDRPSDSVVEVTLWDVPGLNFVVKRERTTRHRRGEVESDRIELVSLRQGPGA